MKRAVLVLVMGLLVAWAQSQPGLLTVFDSAQSGQSLAHRDLVALLRQKRAEGHFAGTGLDLRFQIYDFAEPKMAASLKHLGISGSGTYLCLTHLDAQGRPAKVVWTYRYSTAPEALSALDGQLGLSSGPLDSGSPTPALPAPALDHLNSGEDLPTAGILESHSRRYRFVVQVDGNCVVYRMDGASGVAVWATQTHGGGVRVNLDSRGRFSVLQGSSELWSTPENQEGFYQLQIQDDGNLVVYRRSSTGGVAVWGSGNR